MRVRVQTVVYLLDAALLIALAVLLGVSYAKEEDIDRTFVFILNAALSAFAAVRLHTTASQAIPWAAPMDASHISAPTRCPQLSLVFGYPFTIQYLREAIPRAHWRHPTVIRAAVATTTLFGALSIANTLLYLVSTHGSDLLTCSPRCPRFHTVCCTLSHAAA